MALRFMRKAAAPVAAPSVVVARSMSSALSSAARTRAVAVPRVPAMAASCVAVAAPRVTLPALPAFRFSTASAATPATPAATPAAAPAAPAAAPAADGEKKKEIREWYERRAKDGSVFYEDSFSGEKTTVKPQAYMSLETQAGETGFMRFMRSDQLGEMGRKVNWKLNGVIISVVIGIALYQWWQARKLTQDPETDEGIIAAEVARRVAVERRRIIQDTINRARAQ